MIGSRDRRALAPIARRRIHSLPLTRSIGRVSGLASKATMSRLVAVEAILGERHQPAADTAVPVRVAQLDGNVVWLRPRSRDRAALEFLHLGHHLPPAGLSGPVRHAAVFGANIGLLAADLATRYPQARVLGVETDHDNAVLARRNLAHLADRCTLEQAAVWHRDETLTLAWAPDAWGQAVTGPGDRNGPDPGTGTRYIDAVDAGNLLAAFSGPAPVDYLRSTSSPPGMRCYGTASGPRTSAASRSRSRTTTTRHSPCSRSSATRPNCSVLAGAPSQPAPAPLTKAQSGTGADSGRAKKQEDQLRAGRSYGSIQYRGLARPQQPNESGVATWPARRHDARSAAAPG